MSADGFFVCNVNTVIPSANLVFADFVLFLSFLSLVVVSRFQPSPIVESLLPRLDRSRPFVVFCQYKAVRRYLKFHSTLVTTLPETFIFHVADLFTQCRLA